MRRRAVLATLGTTALAGCGWSQDGGRNPPPGSSGGSQDDGGTRELAESEGGEGPIEAGAEELLLKPEDIGSEWEETEIQRTGTCNAFEWDGDTFTYALESCAAVYEDEETAIEEFESDLDTSSKVMHQQLDLEPEIGDQAAVFQKNTKTSEWASLHIRVQFRDTNATGRVTFIEEDTPSGQPGERLGVPEQYPSDVVEWAAAMHEDWR